MFDAPVEAPLCTDELLLPLLVLGPNVKVLPLPLLLSPPPSNTLSQQLSTSVLEILPDIPVTHLMNLLFEPVLVLPVVDVSFLVLLEPPIQQAIIIVLVYKYLCKVEVP